MINWGSGSRYPKISNPNIISYALYCSQNRNYNKSLFKLQLQVKIFLTLLPQPGPDLRIGNCPRQQIFYSDKWLQFGYLTADIWITSWSKYTSSIHGSALREICRDLEGFSPNTGKSNFFWQLIPLCLWLRQRMLVYAKFCLKQPLSVCL